MKVLYIDIYFLINFTVDALAIYCALWISKLRSSVFKIVISSALGAVFSCIIVITEPGLLLYSALLLGSMAFSCLIISPRASILGKVRLFLGILFFETVIGGIVFWLYSLLDKILMPLIDIGEQGAENKRLLALAMIVLLGIGILKLILRVYSGSLRVKSSSVRISVFGNTVVITGFFDSGNMITDPLSGKPVIIAKYKPMEKLFLTVGGRHAFDEPTDEIKRRMRLIPVKGINDEKVLYGIIADEIYVTAGKKTEPVSAVVAVDFNDGDFGGYDAILPSSLI